MRLRFEQWIYTLPLRWRSVFRRAQVDQELEEELRYHLDRKIEEYTAQGMPPEQAYRAALVAMDGLTQRKEECRDMRQVNLIENTVQDLRYGLRVLAKAPGFTAVAVATLALAIGANAVVFGVLNASILRPLNVPQTESLYGIQHGDEPLSGQSYPDYVDLRDRNRSFESLAAYNITSVGLDTGDSTSRIWALETSGNYFDTLGIRPYLGRFFHGYDEHGPNSAPYAVLSYGYWHDHFADDRSVVGRVVRINKFPFTILGVAPPDFHGTLLFFFPDAFVPMVNQEQTDGWNGMNDRGSRWIFMTMGHLKPGVTTAQAAADLNSIGSYLEKTYPKEDGRRTFALVRPSLYGDYIRRPAEAFLTGVMLLAGLILLAACANLGSLFSARSADRAREVALRLALGSSRSRVLRGLLTEAALISLMGGALGLLGGVVLMRALSVWQPVSRFPIHLEVAPDARVYLVGLGLALMSGLLFGLVPVRQVLRTDPYQVIKSRSTRTGGRWLSARELLLGLQIAICAVLVTSSLVAVRGLVVSQHGQFGFEPEHALLLELGLTMAGYTGEALPAEQKRALEAVRAIPGVTAAATVNPVPLLYGTWMDTRVFADETADRRPENAMAIPGSFSISPDYFRAAGTALLAGRAFSLHDDAKAPRVTVINREFARKVFGSVTGALGRNFRLVDGTRIRVVGVVEDGKYTNLAEDPRLAMFFPELQAPSGEATIVIRSAAARDPRQLAAAVRTSMREMDAGLPLFLQTWTEATDLALFPARVATIALSVLGAIGALLSVTGIFGMAAYSVSRRLRELGIRMALGAQWKEVLQAALGRSLQLLVAGSAAGLALGLLASRLLAAIVYHATPRDPVVLGGVVVAMLALGVLATWIPAQRALSLDPVTLLREE